MQEECHQGHPEGLQVLVHNGEVQMHLEFTF